MLSGAVLSGGLSSRMGEDKGLILLSERALVAHVSGKLRLVADEVIVSVAKGAAQRYREVLGEGVKIVEDKRVGVGPVEGLSRALSVAKGQYVVTAPCDTPFLKPELCRLVIDSAEGRDGAVPMTGTDLFEPLHGVYKRKRCQQAFEKAIKNGVQKPVDIYSELDIEFIPKSVVQTVDPDLESFWNLNTFEDLELAQLELKNGNVKL